MTRSQAAFHMKKLIKENFRIPIKMSMDLLRSVPPDFPVQSDVYFGDIVIPFLEDLKQVTNDRQKLLKIVHTLLDNGCVYPYMSNPDKQKYINELKELFPDFEFPIMYPPGVATPTPTEAEKE